MNISELSSPTMSTGRKVDKESGQEHRSTDSGRPAREANPVRLRNNLRKLRNAQTDTLQRVRNLEEKIDRKRRTKQTVRFIPYQISTG